MQHAEEVKNILRQSIQTTLNEIAPMVAGYAAQYEDPIIDNAIQALKDYGFEIVKKS